MDAPLISFVSIDYNRLEDTVELIESLQNTIHSVTYEIIVIDNSSIKNEADIIHKRFPFVRTVRSRKNIGFSGGNNIGINMSRGKYIFLINNDTYIKEDGLQFLIERLESSPHIAGVSPKIRFAFPPQNIQFAGFTHLTPITLRNKTLGFDCKDEEIYNKPHPTPYLHGAAMMIKKDIINIVGLMPEMFFLYYEELDWSTQMTKAGYELWYEPRCTVFHKESQSIGKMSKTRIFYMTRNRLLFAWRNLSGLRRIMSILYLSILVSAKSSFVFVLHKHFDLAKMIWKGTFAFIKMSKIKNN
ncbi:MAG: glycosyltransferase family 2 protein [Bacteroidaceae bacterium]|nr:glycosyltransferase family 2 protein [Bacteroidaceae bacterium]